jgi:hypothetical protein
MTHTQISKSSKMYSRLFDHCQKQYKNVKEIQKAYIQNNQVYAIDYLTTCGIISIASGTYDADKVIVFN